MNEYSVSKWWRVSVLLVVVIGFSILSFITKEAYDNAPPIPDKVMTPSGALLFSKEDILNGQEMFFKYNLMEHGTLWGHGAYLGPDYSAEYLHQEAQSLRQSVAHEWYDSSFENLDSKQRGGVSDFVIEIIKQNRYDPATGILQYTKEQVEAYEAAVVYWTLYFKNGEAPGLPENYIASPQEARNLTTFFSWAGWAAGVLRPGTDSTYTNNFPYDPEAGNLPGVDAYFWSAMSLMVLLGGIGLLLFLFGKFDFLGWQSNSSQRHAHLDHLATQELTPSQKSVGKFFAIVALLFAVQSLVGGAVAHYRVESTFYGLPIAQLLPYNLLRTWHLQLAIFWIATAWVAGGLFIAPILSGKEPKYQKLGVNIFFVALLFVACGSLIGEFCSSMGWLKETWFWFGAQGSEYLDLGRAWQYLLIVGFAFWLFLLFRSLDPMNKKLINRELIVLFFIAGAAIPIFYVPAVFYDVHTNYCIIDNWRFWIIHLWVEGFFEVFATVLVAVIFTRMGIVRASTAIRVIYLDALLYLGAGVVGTGHHWYFTGQTNVNMALSACFSAAEIIPLTLLTLDGWDFIRASKTSCVECGKTLLGRQRWTIYYLIAVGIWNFIGAGVFGFLINLPIISYFEIGTNLTPNHGHAAMFGVFGMLALGLTMYCVRAGNSDTSWDRVKNWVKVGFWGVNVGMGLMIVLDLFPSGILQLWDSMTHGYWHARQLSFIMSGTFHVLEWVRIIGDMIFIFVGALPTAAAVLYTYWHERKKKDGHVQETFVR